MKKGKNGDGERKGVSWYLCGQRETFDMARYQSGHQWRFCNDEKEISQASKRLVELSPALVVMEATGYIGLPSVAALGGAELTIVVVKPRRLRDFASAIGKLSMTDQ